MQYPTEHIWLALNEVADPEIPVVSVVEMGIVRQVEASPDQVSVVITPTFAGCPALHEMEAGIRSRLIEMGYRAEAIEVLTVFSPPWSSDWISEEARGKLRNFGLAPPPRHGGDLELALHQAAECPYCSGHNTQVRNSFGPTACRMIYFCADCREPFEQFKPL